MEQERCAQELEDVPQPVGRPLYADFELGSNLDPAVACPSLECAGLGPGAPVRCPLPTLSLLLGR